jgi:acyl-CoA thioesterase
MYARDSASQALGMDVVAVAPGFARLTMAVRGDMLNGHGSCHGGLIFSLADSAFAFACNSRNAQTVGVGCSIDYLAPGRPGDVLAAEARELALSGKSGVYDVRVSNQDDVTVALFRGKSLRTGGALVAADEVSNQE